MISNSEDTGERETPWWGYPLTPDELLKIAHAQAEFSTLWASIRPPWPHVFDGTAQDVLAIGYLRYEGLGLPPCGNDGATLVTAEVLRRAVGFHWMYSNRGTWVLCNTPLESPTVVICPQARVDELLLAGNSSAFNVFAYFLCRAIIDCLPHVEPQAKPAMRHLLNSFTDEVADIELLFSDWRAFSESAE